MTISPLKAYAIVEAMLAGRCAVSLIEQPAVEAAMSVLKDLAQKAEEAKAAPAPEQS